MKSIFVFLFTGIFLASCSGQPLVSNRSAIEKANTELEAAMSDFDSCIVVSDLGLCIRNLTLNATDEYRKYIIGNMLYNVDTAQSFKLHKEAYTANPSEQEFLLEYAIELHRKGDYTEAAKLYELYSAKEKDDFRIHVWLADCYINTGEVNKAIENWQKADHAQHHTSIDLAIYTIYGNAVQLEKRNQYRTEISQGKLSSFYALIFLDENWEFDWWNFGVQEKLLAEDIRLAKAKMEMQSEDLKTLEAYTAIKRLEKEPNKADSIKTILLNNNLILDHNPLPPSGRIASDLLRICFANGLLNETEFYQSRGQELLTLAKKTNDNELLNIYANLQFTAEGKVKPETDLSGWKEYHDERFAVSYFIGKGDKNRYDDNELKQALADFPNSAMLYWIKTNCAKIEGKPLKPHLTELIKREFKTLGSDENHYSDRLNSYFGYLATTEK